MNIFVLAAHEPMIDPRVMWSTRSLKKFGAEIYLIGIKNSTGKEYDYQNLPVHTENTSEISLQTYLGAVKFIIFQIMTLKSVLLSTMILFTFHLLWFLGYVKKILVYLKSFFSKKSVANKNESLSPNRTVSSPSFLRMLFFLIKTSVYFCFVVLNQFVKMQKKVDCILCNDLDTLLPAILLKKHNGCRIVYDAHEFYPYQFFNSPNWLIRFLVTYEKWCLKYVDEYITVTPHLGDEIKKEYNYKKEIKIIPNCSPLEKNIIFSEKMNSPDIKFLFQGHFSAGRGLLQIIRHWSKLKNSNFKLYLRGPDGPHKKECKALCEELKILNKTIYFLEPVSEQDLIQAATAFDVGVIPYEPVNINNMYCCPNKLSQFMQAGLPILSNNLPFVKSILEKFGCGVSYKENNFEKFEKALNDLQSEEMRLNMSRKSREAALAQYNWEYYESILIESCGLL